MRSKELSLCNSQFFLLISEILPSSLSGAKIMQMIIAMARVNRELKEFGVISGYRIQMMS